MPYGSGHHPFYLSSPAKCNLFKLFNGRITINIFHVLEFRSQQTSEKPINEHGFHSCSYWVKLRAAEQCWIFRFPLPWSLLSHLAISFSGDKKKRPEKWTHCRGWRVGCGFWCSHKNPGVLIFAWSISVFHNESKHNLFWKTKPNIVQHLTAHWWLRVPPQGRILLYRGEGLRVWRAGGRGDSTPCPHVSWEVVLDLLTLERKILKTAQHSRRWTVVYKRKKGVGIVAGGRHYP